MNLTAFITESGLKARRVYELKGKELEVKLSELDIQFGVADKVYLNDVMVMIGCSYIQDETIILIKNNVKLETNEQLINEGLLEQ